MLKIGLPQGKSQQYQNSELPSENHIYSVSCPEHSFRQEHHAKVEDTQRRSQALS